MQKLCEIEEKLKKEHIDIKSRYVKLKRCKYALLILKTTLLSLSIGLSFLNPLIIIVSSTVPIIDSIILVTNKDKEVSHLKIQNDIINQIIKEIQMKKFTIENDDEAKKYILEVYGKVETFLDIYIVYIMKFINFDNYIEKNDNEYINKNCFVPQHPSNTVILGPTGCSKTNLLFNVLTLNPVYEKIYIITKQPEDKYTFLLNKFKSDVKIFYQNDEYDLDDLTDGKKLVCVIFDDLIKDNNYINKWFVRSRKKNCSNFFLSHSYFKISKTLRLNIHYLILFKIPKNQLSKIYIDQAINIEKGKFYKIVYDLNRYENVLVDLNNPVEQLQIRKDLNEILIK